jgi:hypothetical protein
MVAFVQVSSEVSIRLAARIWGLPRNSVGSPVPPGLLTETRLACLQPLSSSPLTVLTPLVTLYSFFTSPLLFSFTLYFLLHTSQRSDVVIRLPELAYVT